MKLGTEEMYFSIIKAIYDSNIVKEEKQKPFPICSRMKQGCPVSPLLFNTVLEFLNRAIK
jgi:hypothetical protein